MHSLSLQHSISQGIMAEKGEMDEIPIAVHINVTNGEF